MAAYNAEGECVGGELAVYLKRNYTESKSECQSQLRKLKELYLDPLINYLTPATVFTATKAALTRIISEYQSTCVGPATEEVLSDFIAVSVRIYDKGINEVCYSEMSEQAQS